MTACVNWPCTWCWSGQLPMQHIYCSMIAPLLLCQSSCSGLLLTVNKTHNMTIMFTASVSAVIIKEKITVTVCKLYNIHTPDNVNWLFSFLHQTWQFWNCVAEQSLPFYISASISVHIILAANQVLLTLFDCCQFQCFAFDLLSVHFFNHKMVSMSCGKREESQWGAKLWMWSWQGEVGF